MADAPTSSPVDLEPGPTDGSVAPAPADSAAMPAPAGPADGVIEADDRDTQDGAAGAADSADPQEQGALPGPAPASLTVTAPTIGATPASPLSPGA